MQKWVKPNLTPHHVHDGEDVGLHIIAAVVLNEFGVSHHHGLNPALSADRALWPGLRLILPPLLLPLPFLPLSLHLDGVAESIYSTDKGRNHTTFVAYSHLTYTHLCALTQTSAVLHTYIQIHTLNSTGAGCFSGLCAAFCSVIFWSNSWIDNVGLWSLCRIIRIIRRLLDRFNEKVSFWQGEEASLRKREMRNRWICIKQKCFVSNWNHIWKFMQSDQGVALYLLYSVYRPYKGFWQCGPSITHYHLDQRLHWMQAASGSTTTWLSVYRWQYLFRRIYCYVGCPTRFSFRTLAFYNPYQQCMWQVQIREVPSTCGRYSCVLPC